MRTFYFIFLACILTCVSCVQKSEKVVIPFFNESGAHVGDSIYSENLLVKVLYYDSAYIIDSLVWKRYENADGALKSMATYKNGKTIFENIEYYENGTIKKYQFIDEDKPTYLYERTYDESGKLLKVNGDLFFQGYVTNINTATLELKKGQEICYRVFHPNPPDCNARVVIKNDDESIYDVFKKSDFLSYLKTASNNNSELGTYKVNIMLELSDVESNRVQNCNQAIFFKVIP